MVGTLSQIAFHNIARVVYVRDLGCFLLSLPCSACCSSRLMVLVVEVEAVGVGGRRCRWQWVAAVEVEAQHSKKRWEVEAAQQEAALVANSMMRLEEEEAQGAVAPWEVGSQVVAL